MSPSRRAVLALLGTGATAGLAGCNGFSPSRDDAPSSTSTTRPDQTTSRRPTSASVDLASVEARQGARYRIAGVHPAAVTVTDRQIVVVHVTGPVSHDDVRLVLDGITHHSADAVGGVDREKLRVVRTATDDEAVAVFVLPLDVPAESGTIHVQDGAHWALDERVLAHVRSPPDLSVVDFRAPTRTARHSTAKLTATVRNDGGTEGTFLATMGTTALSGQPVFALVVPAGRTATHTMYEELVSDGDTEGVKLDWTTGRREHTIQFAD